MNANMMKSCLIALVRLALLCGLGVAAVSAIPTRAQEPSEAASGPVVDIQNATAEQLQQLPGIGPSKAAAIVAYRAEHPFRRVEDIMRVRGIGRATFRRLRPMLTVAGAGAGDAARGGNVRAGTRQTRSRSED